MLPAWVVVRIKSMEIGGTSCSTVPAHNAHTQLGVRIFVKLNWEDGCVSVKLSITRRIKIARLKKKGYTDTRNNPVRKICCPVFLHRDDCCPTKSRCTAPSTVVPPTFLSRPIFL